jgi:hypothetical protein
MMVLMLASAGQHDRGGDRMQAARHPTLVYKTDCIRIMDEVDLPGRYRPYLWKMSSWLVTSTSAT